MRKPFSNLSKGFACFLLSLLFAASKPACADDYKTFNISAALQSGATVSGTVQLDYDSAGSYPYLTNWDVTITEATGIYYITKANYQGACPPGQSCVEDAALNSDGSAVLLIYIDSGSDYLTGYKGGQIIPEVNAANEANSGFGYTDANGNSVFDNLVSGSLKPAMKAPGIYYNGQNSAELTQPIPVVIGQLIKLKGFPITGSWATPLSGSPIGDFQAVGCTGEPTPPDCHSQITSDVDTSGSSLSFYWYVPSTTEYDLTFNYSDEGGTSQMLTVRFQVTGPPQPAISDPVLGIVGVPYYPLKCPSHEPRVDPAIGLGESDCDYADQGIKFDATSGNFSGGKIEWLQTVNDFAVTHYRVGGGSYEPSIPPGLDTRYPYAPSNGAKTLAADAPNVSLCSNGKELKDDEVTAFEQFSMYLMWKPELPDAIYVPLGHVDWQWQAVATGGPSKWITYSSSETQSGLQSLSSNPKVDFPSWTLVTKAKTVCLTGG